MALPVRALSLNAGSTRWQTQPRFETLESRNLLSLTQPIDNEQLFGVPTEPTSVVQTDDPALFDRDDWTDLFDDSDGTANDDADNGPLPIIPLDDSFEPYLGCPGLDDDFCLPTSGEMDFGFDDFLRLQSNFGLEGATRSDGDLDGDGRVTFSDFLLLSENFS